MLRGAWLKQVGLDKKSPYFCLQIKKVCHITHFYSALDPLKAALGAAFRGGCGICRTLVNKLCYLTYFLGRGSHPYVALCIFDSKMIAIQNGTLTVFVEPC